MHAVPGLHCTIPCSRPDVGVFTSRQAAASLVSMYRAGRKMQGLGEGEEAEEAIKARLHPTTQGPQCEALIKR